MSNEQHPIELEAGVIVLGVIEAAVLLGLIAWLAG